MRRLLAIAALLLAWSPAWAGGISGAGSTFAYPIFAKWAAAYKLETGVAVNYQSIGSGGGIKQIKAGTVTFGASDMPLAPADLEGAGLVQFPAIMGGTVPVVNLHGIRPGELTLDGPTLAGIYLGRIASWDDPRIKALNPGIALPDKAIAVVHRSDGSGTTFLFTNYLSQVSPDWQSEVGASTAVEWPAGIGAKGNEGVANMAEQTDGAIGYVEYAYAKQNELTFTRMTNKDGKAVAPGIAAFEAAAANADWAAARDFRLVLTDQPGAASWPIVGATFVILHGSPRDPSAAAAALEFFDWSFRNGKEMARRLAYVPMPDKVVDLIRKTWARQVKAADGRPLRE